MCDYSLHLVASRPAKVGDKLVTTKFKNSITGDFAGVQEPSVAVCLLPGTEVAFEREVECEHVFKVFRSQKLLSEKVARFRQINLEEHNAHHDALEFPDGQVVLLTRLCAGQHATVLQLPAAVRAGAEVDERQDAAVVA
jgi:hypothetical protein